MQTRGKFLDVRHTLSHLEHRVSPDPDLNERRKSLAAADSEADRGHHALHAIQDPSGIESFALYVQGTLVEKASKTPFKHLQMRTRKELLYTKRLEGATHKTGPTLAGPQVAANGPHSYGTLDTNLSRNAYQPHTTGPSEATRKTEYRLPDN